MSSQPEAGGSVLRLGNRTVPLQSGAKVEREPARVDFVIVFDTTGSMSDKRADLIAGMHEFVTSLDGYGLDWRVSVVPFGDLEIPRDRVDGNLPFVASTTAAIEQLERMPSFAGGSNGGESSIEAMQAALAKPWRARALKVVVLLTDDYALGSRRARQVTARLVQSDTLCFTAAPDTPYYREWATQTGGTWSQIRAGYDATAIHVRLRTLLREVARSANEVHRRALGSPRRLRELTNGSGD